MLDPILLVVLGTLMLIGSVIGIIAVGGQRLKPRAVALDLAAGGLAALAIGFPAVHYLGTDVISFAGHLAVIGSPEPLLLPLGAYLAGAVTTMGLARAISA